MKDFKTEVYTDILEKLSLKNKYITKTDYKTNHVKIIDNKVFVKTEKSAPNFEEIPSEMFEKTWDILCDLKRVTQRDLSKKYNIKRSAFILIAFDLLEYVKYNSFDNSLKLIRDNS